MNNRHSKTRNCVCAVTLELSRKCLSRDGQDSTGKKLKFQFAAGKLYTLVIYGCLNSHTRPPTHTVCVSVSSSVCYYLPTCLHMLLINSIWNDIFRPDLAGKNYFHAIFILRYFTNMSYCRLLEEKHPKYTFFCRIYLLVEKKPDKLL